MDFFGDNLKNARKNYYNLIFKCNEEKLKQEFEFEDEKTEYKSERKIIVRNFKPEDILEFIVYKNEYIKDSSS